MGNLGQTFAFGAAGTHVMFMLITFAVGSTTDGMETWKDKYPDRAAITTAMGNFKPLDCALDCVVSTADSLPTNACAAGCSDSVNILKDVVRRVSDIMPMMVFNGLFQSTACLLAMFAILSMKAQSGFQVRPPRSCVAAPQVCSATCVQGDFSTSLRAR